MVAGTQHVITLWTNDPKRAGWAGRHGIDRIGLDLETLGKSARQKGLATWISPHRIEDLKSIRPVLGKARLFVRCNPLGPHTQVEVDRLLACGVEVLMLPNFTEAREVEHFMRIVDGRARVVPLIERAAALPIIKLLAGLGIGELHVGLNDLSIDLGQSNRLVVLAGKEVARFAEEASALGMSFGLGGLGRAFDEALPVPSDLVYAQHARLGASGALLARSFFKKDMTELEFAAEIAALHQRLDFWRDQPAEALERARVRLLQYAAVAT